MQYKIPVQIENDDPIVLWLSLKQLIIIMVWGWIAYWIFNSLTSKVWPEIALVPSVIILAITLFVALFKQYEMTFIPFILSLLRFNINYRERMWQAKTDSFHPLDIWIIVVNTKKDESQIDFKDKMEKIKTLEENIDKI
jgi:hypothetical protein